MANVLIFFDTASPNILSANSMILQGHAHVAPYANRLEWQASVAWSSNATQVRDAVIASVQAAANAADTIVTPGDTKIFFGIPQGVIA